MTDKALAALEQLDLSDAQLEVLGKRITDLLKRQQRITRSRRQEREGMGRFGGVTHPRSGARWDKKNDGHTCTELVEFKRTDSARSITLRYTDLRDLERNALAQGRRPVLGFELGGADYVVLREQDYLAGRGAPGSGHDPGPHFSGTLTTTAVDGQSQVSWVVRQRPGEPVLRGLPVQRPGRGGQEHLPRDAPRSSRRLPRDGRVSGVRAEQRGTLRRVGRVQRAGASPDQETETP